MNDDSKDVRTVERIPTPTARPLHIRLATSFLVSLMLVAACTSDEEPEPQSDTGTEPPAEAGTAEGQIRYSFWGLPEELSVQEQLAEAFEAQQPDITVELNHVSEAGEFPAQMLTQISGGNPPDVFYIGEARVPSFAASNALTNLAPFIERDGLDMGAFFERNVDPVTDDEGNVWALAKDTTAFMLYYNERMFDEAGVPLPDSDWTWDEMVSAAETLTVDPDGDGRVDQWGLGLDTGWTAYMPAIYSNGGAVLNDAANECLLDQPESTEALQRMADLMHEDPIVAPSPEALTGMGVGTLDLFNSGQVAMITAGRWGAFFVQPLEDPWGVAPYPYMAEPKSVALFVTLAIPHNAPNPEAAWEFIKFVVSEEGQEINASTGLGLPVLQSVAEEGTSWLVPGEPTEHVDIYTDSLANRAENLPYHPQWAETIDEIAARELDDLWLGNRSAEEVTSDICSEINPIIADN